MIRARPGVGAALAAVVGLAAGCGGSPSTGPAPMFPAPDASGPDTAPAVDPVEEAAVADCEAAPRRRLWRLSDMQYQRAVADLLPGVTSPEVPTPGRHPLEFVDVAGTREVDGALTALYRDAARSIADHALPQLPDLLACRAGEPEGACADRFIARFGARAFRRPLDAEERAALVGVYRSEGDHLAGARLVLEAIFQAPAFIYRTELGSGPSAAPGTASAAVPLTAHELASALSFFLLDSVPDAPLWAAAEQGVLAQPEALAAQVDRLLALPRARENLADVMQRWLGSKRVLSRDDLDTRPFPAFDELRAPLVAESARLMGALLASGGTLGDLLLSRQGPEDPRLAAYRPGARAGVLTTGAFVSSMLPYNRSVHRGLTVMRAFLCTAIPPPPPGIPTRPPLPEITTERAFVAYRAAQSCHACHQHFDGLGLAFEQYDAFGRYLPVDDAGAAVDASGALTLDGERHSFTDVAELAGLLAGSPQVLSCVTGQMLAYALGVVTPAPACTARIERRTAAAGGSLAEMFRAIATDPLFRLRRAQ
jgi:hypothetical protein